MKENEFRWFRKHHSRMIVSLGDFIKTGKDESLHKARVACKHMRSIQWLLKREHDKKKIDKIFDPLKSIYKSTGTTRDRDLFHKWVSSQGVRIKRKPTLRAKKNNGTKIKKVFEKNLPDFNKIPGKIFPLLKKWKKKDTRKAMVKIKKKVIENLTGPTAVWHETRKKTKHLAYLYELSGLETNDKKTPFKKFDILQDVLGKWQDADTFSKMIARSKSFTKKDKTLLTGKIKKKKLALEKKIRAAV